ncbi:protein-tyrosine phosphatase [Meira miltonrushii]|uniref:Protein-tyrosine phosphatase n=1 Tax=Meira miltonrushii TaxID=1280837 RepID=A0A316VP65_9BASI|nr:protein-tyrosine phosphatase [Meira miltonrushii]PWN37921.1 protein-tyrosine phosphatase [Meira miltonrushii]
MICASRTRSGGAIYRSGFPNERNYPFLNTLHLRTIIYLSTDEIRENLRNYVFANRQRVKLLQFPVQVNKEPFQEMDQNIVLEVLRAILDKRNHPILIHCNKGKYRVGVITALIRRLQGWNMTSIYDEYARFAGSDRIADEEFIDMFPISQIRPDRKHTPDWCIIR